MTTTPDLWRNPFLDNTSTDGNQDSGVVAPTAGDQFFAVWRDTFLNPEDIIVRSFDSLGNHLTAEMKIHTPFGGELREPAAVRLPITGQADGLAVAFTNRVGGDDDIYLVKTNSALGLLQPPIAIDNTGGGVNTDRPSNTSFSNGSLLVAYT